MILGWEAVRCVALGYDFPQINIHSKERKNEAGGKKERPQVTKANLPNSSGTGGKLGTSAQSAWDWLAPAQVCYRFSAHSNPKWWNPNHLNIVHVVNM